MAQIAFSPYLRSPVKHKLTIKIKIKSATFNGGLGLHESRFSLSKIQNGFLPLLTHLSGRSAPAAQGVGGSNPLAPTIQLDSAPNC